MTRAASGVSLDSQLGGENGGWYNQNTGETLLPDLEHGPPGPHWDWIPIPRREQYRVFPEVELSRRTLVIRDEIQPT